MNVPICKKCHGDLRFRDFFYGFGWWESVGERKKVGKERITNYYLLYTYCLRSTHKNKISIGFHPTMTNF